jgi:SAM-dependent MidA family methyltransferase
VCIQLVDVHGHILVQKGFRKHEIVDALTDPGNIDITSDVDFEELALTGSQIANGRLSYVTTISMFDRKQS